MSIGTLWNEKFTREGYLYGKAPNAFLKRHIDTFKTPCSILFLGEGEGRNAAYAASLGHDVSALDASQIGLKKASRLAAEMKVSIELLHVDLEHWVPSRRYDVVMCSFLHLQEPLRTVAFRNALKALKPNGKFYGEFFSTAQLPLKSGGPKDLSLLYTIKDFYTIFSQEHATMELLEELSDTLNEGSGHQGSAQLIRVIAQNKPS
jgi:2-polyprenyl-3-methyl-5-hydroxy-6-metoxy-1,4-benzoquinol methylase